MISQSRGGVDSFYSFDALGSTRQLTDTAAISTDAYLYDSFGSPISSSRPTANPFRFIGRLGYYTDADPPSLFLRRGIISLRRERSCRKTFLHWSPAHQPVLGVYISMLGICPTMLTDPGGLLATCAPPPELCGPDVTAWFEEQLKTMAPFKNSVDGKHNVVGPRSYRHRH